MAKIEFGTEVSQLQRDGFDLARADEPDFDLARWHLKTARDVVYTSSIRLKSDIFYSIVARDLGIIDVREGLYLYDKKGIPEDETLGYVNTGITSVRLSYDGLSQVLRCQREELDKRGWVESVNNNIFLAENDLDRACRAAVMLSEAAVSDETIAWNKPVPPALDYQRF